jgi:hypothetical protein
MAGKGGAIPGNGRKSKDEENRIRDLMKPHSEEAIKCLVNIMTDDKARSADRISASKLIIEYTYGKPKETVDSNVTISEFNIKDIIKFKD